MIPATKVSRSAKFCILLSNTDKTGCRVHRANLSIDDLEKEYKSICAAYDPTTTLIRVRCTGRSQDIDPLR